MDYDKVQKAHKQLIMSNKEDPNCIEKSADIPFSHTPGENGMVYPHHNYHGGTWDDRVNTIPQFNARPDDLFISCFPRSGSNWVQNMIKHILDMPSETIIINVVRWFEGHSNDQLDKIPSPRMFKTHMKLDILPQNCKYIYISRNPFDNCVANYEILRGYITFGCEDMSLDTYLDLYLQGKVIFGSWFDHVEQGFKAKHKHNVLFLRYEDMKQDEVGTVLNIARYLGRDISPDRAAEIAQKTTFQKMRRDPTANHEWSNVFANEGFDFIRKGIVGDYVNYFSPAQLTMMKLKLTELSEAGVDCFDEFL